MVHHLRHVYILRWFGDASRSSPYVFPLPLQPLRCLPLCGIFWYLDQRLVYRLVHASRIATRAVKLGAPTLTGLSHRTGHRKTGPSDTPI